MPMTAVFIPAELRSQLDALEPTLVKQGIVQRHRNVYRLRFRRDDPDSGRRIHHSVRIGSDPALAQAVIEHLVLIREKSMERSLILSNEEACQQAVERAKEAEAQRLKRLERDQGQNGKKSQPADPMDDIATLLSLLNQLRLATIQSEELASRSGHTSNDSSERLSLANTLPSK